MIATRRYAATFAAALEAPAVGRAAFAAFLLALLGYGAYFAYYMIASLDVVNLHRDTLLDDAFYYFEIAKNFAGGKFSTFDGGITTTNGYHPVWVFLITPLYWFLDAEAALFGIKAVEVMLIAGGVCLAALAVRQARLPWILLFAVLPAIYSQRGMVLGMEAAAGVFSLGAFFYAAVLFAGDPARWRRWLAVLAFMLPWVRLEYVAISLLLTVALYFLPDGRRQTQGYFSAARLRTEGVPALAAVAGLLAYFLYNGIVFGGIVPVSGASKLAWSQAWFAKYTGDSMEDFAVAYKLFLQTARWDLIYLSELCVYALLAFGIGLAAGWRREDRLLLAVLAFVLALALETVVLKAQVALFYHADVRRSTFWYYAPGHLMAALMVPMRCYVAIALLRLAARDRFQTAARAGVLTICLVGIYASFDRYVYTEPFRQVEHSRNSHYLDDVWAPARGGVDFDAMLPEDAVIGSWDAGEVGYFTDLPVVNLDGLANSYDYLQLGGDAWELWTERGGVPAFGITHFVNHVFDRHRLLLDTAFEYVGHRMELARKGYSLRLWPVDGHEGRAKSWPELAAASHGADGTDNGYFELRSGRVMQIFVPNCEADAVPELLRFSWSAGSAGRKGDSSAVRFWPRPERTALGYCTNTFLLPHGAEEATAIAVDGMAVERYVRGTAPVARAAYDLYAKGGSLIYVGDQCSHADAGIYSYLHIHPARRRDLALDRQVFGFANYDNRLHLVWRNIGEGCVAVVELPAYDIDAVRTGQETNDERTWRARIDGLALRPAALDGFLAGADQIVAAGYQGYVSQEQNKLVFIQASGEQAQRCAPELVFLHIHPRRIDDLPAWQRQYGFANYDFDFGEAGFVSAGRCAVVVQLPDYAISHAKTGTPGSSEHTWRWR